MIHAPLPALDDPYVPAPDAVAAFRRDGHVLIRGVATAEEVAAYRPAITAATLRHSTETRPLAERDTYGRAFLQVWNLWRHDPDVARFVLARRFAGAAAALLGAPAVRLYHDQALYKEPGGGRTPWHQDAVYWPLDGSRCVTMWMPLVDITPAMGAMTFASGTNVPGGGLGDVVISDDSDEHFEELLARAGARRWAPQPMAAGDATFHGGWTVHRADPNGSDVLREVMTVIWFADGLRVQEPVNEAQAHDLAVWLPGLRPGDLAASELNPRC